MSDNKQKLDSLKAAAVEAQKNSYSPYSQFKVGATILGDDGQQYSGCNIENASYPLGQCAEASAIGVMINGGARHIKEIMIASPTEEFCPPCGGCRQKIHEFADENTLVHLMTNQGDVKTLKMTELLPHSFSFEENKK